MELPKISIDGHDVHFLEFILVLYLTRTISRVSRMNKYLKELLRREKGKNIEICHETVRQLNASFLRERQPTLRNLATQIEQESKPPLSRKQSATGSHAPGRTTGDDNPEE